MSSVYGYAQSLSEGSAYNARVLAHNDLVKEHNNKVLFDYDNAVKQQKRDASDDKGTVKEDAAIDGTQDGKGLLTAAYGAYKFGQSVADEGGVGAAFAKQVAERQGTIRATLGRLGEGAKAAVTSATTDLSSAAGDIAGETLGRLGEGAKAAVTAATTDLSSAAGDIAGATLGRLGKGAKAAVTATTDVSSAAGDIAGATGDAARAAGNAARAAGNAARAAGNAATGAAGAIGDAARAAATGAAGAAGDAGAVAGAGATAVEDAGKIESSGIASAIIKGGLTKIPGASALLGEAGLSTISEIGGKAVGDFAGLVDVGEGFANLADNKNFFGNDDTAEKWGDSFQMAGAALDVVGTAFPPLELLGGAVGLLGGVIDGIDGLSKDEAKKQSDAAPITDPNKDPDDAGIQKTQISPAFQAMGLVASAPISAKSLITGSGAF